MNTQEAYNMDCMDLMAQYPDKYFDLAVVDPPYGIG
jgi:site-specific DNA-methyltransferase (adenine-specific)